MTYLIYATVRLEPFLCLYQVLLETHLCKLFQSRLETRTLRDLSQNKILTPTQLNLVVVRPLPRNDWSFDFRGIRIDAVPIWRLLGRLWKFILH